MINDRFERGSTYFNEIRPEVLDLVQGTPRSALDVGCGTGALLAELHRVGERQVEGGVDEIDVLDAVVRDGIWRRDRETDHEGRLIAIALYGGLAVLVAPLCKEVGSVHSDLTLVGLRIAAAALGLKW